MEEANFFVSQLGEYKMEVNLEWKADFPGGRVSLTVNLGRKKRFANLRRCRCGFFSPAEGTPWKLRLALLLFHPKAEGFPTLASYQDLPILRLF